MAWISSFSSLFSRDADASLKTTDISERLTDVRIITGKLGKEEKPEIAPCFAPGAANAQCFLSRQALLQQVSKFE